MQDIDNLQSAITKNPDAAMQSVKFMGNPGSSHFYLGKPAPKARHPQPSKSDALAARWYQDSNPDQPETIRLQERREPREHVKESLLDGTVSVKTPYAQSDPEQIAKAKKIAREHVK